MQARSAVVLSDIGSVIPTEEEIEQRKRTQKLSPKDEEKKVSIFYIYTTSSFCHFINIS